MLPTPVLCHNLQEIKYNLFKGLATKGKTLTVCFVGFKLYLNNHGKIVNTQIT